MDQLIDQIVQRTGISADQARQAVQIVANFAKDRLPEPIASQVQNVLGGGQGASSSGGLTDQASQAMGGLGNLFGGGQQQPQ